MLEPADSQGAGLKFRSCVTVATVGLSNSGFNQALLDEPAVEAMRDNYRQATHDEVKL